MGKNITVSFSTDWQDILNEFPVQIRLAVYGALAEYGITGTVPDLDFDPAVKMAFLFIKKGLDAKAERRRRMAERCRRAREERQAEAVGRSGETPVRDLTPGQNQDSTVAQENAVEVSEHIGNSITIAEDLPIAEIPCPCQEHDSQPSEHDSHTAVSQPILCIQPLQLKVGRGYRNLSRHSLASRLHSH